MDFALFVQNVVPYIVGGVGVLLVTVLLDKIRDSYKVRTGLPKRVDALEQLAADSNQLHRYTLQELSAQNEVLKVIVDSLHKKEWCNGDGDAAVAKMQTVQKEIDAYIDSKAIPVEVENNVTRSRN